MKTDPFSQNVSARICKHMNNDHQEALIQYATRYGGINKPTKAKMIELTSLAMKLEVDGDVIEISFDHKLIDSTDAHKTLVAMLKGKTEHL